ncbi:hypothetical protein [Breoghania sp. L-A4]|uniref:hypothetical protein n=1 Tax=Breoghania sp. L-A4 TaxID=2304600 RepID=UPI0013C336E5|nr:hypothetical protein [Breoghania sp. L-A4]
MKSIDIEDLVHWALRDQAVGHDLSEGAYGPEGLRSSWHSVETILQLGTMVDTFGRANGKGAMHPDAVLVGDALRGMDAHERRLVLGYGMAGTRPDWDYEPELRPFIGANGKPEVVKLVERGQRGLRDVPHRCDLELRPSLEVVAHAWATYRDWWFALTFLSALLRPKLASHAVTGPKAPFSPWLGMGLAGLIEEMTGGEDDASRQNADRAGGSTVARSLDLGVGLDAQPTG